MDVFSRTLRPVAVEARVPTPGTHRHMSIMRRCIQSGDAPVLVTRCIRPDRPTQGEYLLLLTYRRLVVTQRSRLLQRLRLHLDTDLRHLSNVTWSPDPRLPVVELAATAIDGVRERFLIRAGHDKRLWQVDALLNHVFRSRAGRRPAPAGQAAGADRSPAAPDRPEIHPANRRTPGRLPVPFVSTVVGPTATRPARGRRRRGVPVPG